LGRVLRAVHSTRLPVQTETFSPKWSGIVRAFQAKIRPGDYDSGPEKELASFWDKKRAEIAAIVDRAEALGRMLQHASPELALCHTDIHTANILLDKDGGLHIVDWDAPLLAPKERDLMFVVGGVAAVTKQEELFFKGYGRAEIDPLALAYYRYEWVVQELGDFGERVFLTKNTGVETRLDAVRGFCALFEAGDVVDEAYRSDRDDFSAG
jgi:spectinomycin phosphotransferase